MKVKIDKQELIRLLSSFDRIVCSLDEYNPDEKRNYVPAQRFTLLAQWIPKEMELEAEPVKEECGTHLTNETCWRCSPKQKDCGCNPEIKLMCNEHLDEKENCGQRVRLGYGRTEDGGRIPEDGTCAEEKGKCFLHDGYEKQPIEGKPIHKMYCRKSGMSCLVIHPDGICPDERDCEACK